MYKTVSVYKTVVNVRNRFLRNCDTTTELKSGENRSLKTKVNERVVNSFRIRFGVSFNVLRYTDCLRSYDILPNYTSLSNPFPKNEKFVHNLRDFFTSGRVMRWWTLKRGVVPIDHLPVLLSQVEYLERKTNFQVKGKHLFICSLVLRYSHNCRFSLPGPLVPILSSFRD